MDDVRLRGYYPAATSIKALHLDFMRKSPVHRREVPLGATYHKVLKTLFGKIFNEIVFNGYMFKFRKLGKFYAVKYMPTIKETEDGKIITNKPVDFPSTYRVRRETGDNTLMVYFDNEATGGLTYKLVWDTSVTRFINKTFYKFSLQKELKSIFSKAVLAGEVRATLINIKI
jgi:hypothetical protein